MLITSGGSTDRKERAMRAPKELSKKWNAILKKKYGLTNRDRERFDKKGNKFLLVSPQKIPTNSKKCGQYKKLNYDIIDYEKPFHRIIVELRKDFVPYQKISKILNEDHGIKCSKSKCQRIFKSYEAKQLSDERFFGPTRFDKLNEDGWRTVKHELFPFASKDFESFKKRIIEFGLGDDIDPDGLIAKQESNRKKVRLLGVRLGEKILQQCEFYCKLVIPDYLKKILQADCL